MSAAAMRAAARPRVRDPVRRQRILLSTTTLLAQRGYHSVTMADIDSAAGIVGSGVYRHFPSKSDVLVALFDEVMQDLLRSTENAAGLDPGLVLAELIDGQVQFAVQKRHLVRLYQREMHNLPDPDQARLRRLQRLYIEEWVHVVRELRGNLPDPDARVQVHAAIGAIQSVVTFDPGLPRDRLADRLAATAWSCLRPDGAMMSGEPGGG